MPENISPLFISDSKLSRDSYPKKFIHHCYILFYCKKGCAKLNCAGNMLVIEQNSFALISPDTEYICINNNADSITFGFNCNHAFAEVSTASIYMDIDLEILNILTNIQNELSGHLPYDNECILSYYKIIVLLIARYTENSVKQTENDGVEQQLQYISEYLEQHYSQNIDFISLFETLGYSYNHLRHAFKQYFGCAPKQYLMGIRLREARKLLSETAYPLKTVAQKCGFSSTNRFNTHFMNYFGISPSDYKEALNESDSNYNLPQRRV